MITKEQLAQLYPQPLPAQFDALVSQGPQLFARYGIDGNTSRLGYFLAQIGHESDGLAVVEENLHYSANRLTEVWPAIFPNLAAASPYANNPRALANKVYGGRLGNGPEASGDGWNYRGQGLIQITGRENYRQLEAAGIPGLENNPAMAQQPEYALLTACAFWQWKALNSLADARNFKQLTYRINGGYNGLDDRIAWLNKVNAILSPTQTAPSSPARVLAVQKALLARGYDDVGAADGLAGPKTLGAVRRFRADNALPPGGIDQTLLQSLAIPG